MRWLMGEWEREREAIEQAAELRHCREIKAEQRKWEARQQRLVEQLEGFKGADRGGGMEDLGEMDEGRGLAEEWKRRAEALGEEVGRKEETIARLAKKKVDLKMDVEELKAELALAHARMCRAEVTGMEVRGAPASTIRAVASIPNTADDSPVHPMGSHSITATHFPGSPAAGSLPSGVPCTGTATLTLDSAAPVYAPGITSLHLPVLPALPLTSSLAAPATAQLPQIPLVFGENPQTCEMFSDWQEQFEAVAKLGAWNEHCKLVHLMSRLRGKAYTFYRACTPAQRSDYHLLCEELKKQFTPVQLTAVQTQLFHDQRQNPQELVNDFAEDLKRLYTRAYAERFRTSVEAERMREMILANQFIAGLLPI